MCRARVCAGGAVALAVRPARSHTGFSLVELLIVVGIVASLVAIIVPTVSRARESAVRVQCASNLRQCGLADRQYANDNDGWLLLRKSGIASECEYISPVDGGYMSISISRYAPPNIWYCPEYRSLHKADGQLWTDADKAAAVAKHTIGYAVFGASWDPASGKTNPTAPWWGINDVLNGNAFKVHHLKARHMRMTEWYVTGTGWFDKPFAFHNRGKRAKLNRQLLRPEGGNMLMGDGSVQWTAGMWKDFGNSDVPIFAAPAHRNYWP